MIRKTFSSDKKNTYFYWTEGNPEKMPLLLLPGFTGTHEDLLLSASFLKENYFVITTDFPGWGVSHEGDYSLTISGYAKFINDLLEHMQLQRKVCLVGHCMGGAVAIEFAHLHPEKLHALFLISIPYLEGNLSNILFHFLSHASERVPKVFRPFLFFFRSRIFAIPLGFFVIQSRSIKKKLSIIFQNSIRQQFQKEEVTEKNWTSLVEFDYKKIHTLSLPIHIFHGAKDFLISPLQAHKLAALSPTSSIDILPRAGHIPPIETPQALAMAVEKYL